MRNKKKIAFGAAALAVVMVAAGTYAWFSTTDKTKTNVFGMDNFDVTITEAFDTPEVPLVPGADITKEVGVTNSGNVPVVVRVKLEETLELLEQETGEDKDKLKVVYTESKDAEEGQVPVLISQKMIEAYEGNKYESFLVDSYNNLTGITVLRKKTTKDGSNNGNTVYSYLAYVTEESPVGSGNHHLVQVTPAIGNGSAEKPGSFTVKYAYNKKKDANPDNKKYQVTAIHGKTGEDERLNHYYGGDTFHDAVVLNFAENVNTNSTVDDTNTKWVLMDDGYFYYTKALNGTSISEPLLKSVSIKQEAGNTLKGATYTITPVMEAVQMNWEAAKNTWSELKNSPIGDTVTGNVMAADQLVYNIISFEDHLGYHNK